MFFDETREKLMPALARSSKPALRSISADATNFASLVLEIRMVAAAASTTCVTTAYSRANVSPLD